MNLFNKINHLLPALALLMIFGRINASPFDTDTSDWSQGESGLCTKGEFDDLEHTVEKYRKKLGIKAPIIIKEGAEARYDYGDGLRFFDYIKGRKYSSSLPIPYIQPHYIRLPKSDIQILNEVPFLGRHWNNNYWGTIWTLCHEMGHAKQSEDEDYADHLEKSFDLWFKKLFSLSFQEKDQIKKQSDALRKELESKKLPFYEIETAVDKLRAELNCKYCNDRNLLREEERRFYNQLDYESELYADASVPDEKQALSAGREYFRKLHHDLHTSITERIDCPSNLKTIGEIDFSQPMNEKHAQTWDKFHRDILDHHPCHYRRAYLFNERLKTLEARDRDQERKLCKKIAKYVRLLTTSDIVS